MAIGIDVSKLTFDVTIYNNEKTTHAKFDNEEKGYKLFIKWLKKHNVEHELICMESTGHYSYSLALYLHEKHFSVAIVNPLRIKKFAQCLLQRTKNDKVDSAIIAEYSDKFSPPIWTPPSALLKELQECVRYRASLVELKTRVKLRSDCGYTSASIKTVIKQQLTEFNAHIQKIEKRIKELIKSDMELQEKKKLLCSIPGIGEVTAATFLAEIGDINRFETVGQIVAYCGLSPSNQQSGTSLNYSGSISRIGNRHMRTALFMPAMTARRCNPILSLFADRLDAKGKPPKKVIVAVMRKLIHLMYGVLKHGKPFDPNYLK